MTNRFVRRPGSGLYRPLSATEERLAYFLQKKAPPAPWTPSGAQLLQSVRARYEADVQFRALVDERFRGELSVIVEMIHSIVRNEVSAANG